MAADDRISLQLASGGTPDMQLATERVTTVDGENVAAAVPPVFVERFLAAFGTGGAVQTVSAATPLPVDPAAGAWTYRAGASGAVNVPTRVLALHALAGEVGGSIQIGNGDVIPLAPNAAFSLSPRGVLTNVTITFTGTIAYVVERT